MKNHKRNRSPHSGQAPPSPGVDYNGYREAPRESEYANDNGSPHREALRLFFELRDRKYLRIVDSLFDQYRFEEIAHGISNKYHILPKGWEQDLIRLKRQFPAAMQWFNQNKAKYLTETTEQYPSIDKQLKFPTRDFEVDNVVDEFISNEKLYQSKLSLFVTAYVSEIEAISDEKVGERARDALGLSKEQVNFIFGKNLKNVKDVAEDFLIHLETLTLVPGIPAGGRGLRLAQIILECGNNLVKAYGPYNANLSMAKTVLDQQIQKMNAIPTTPSLPGNISHLNFVQLWEEIRQAKPGLKSAATLDSILSTPIKRFPNYKLFIERIIKLTPDDNPDKGKLRHILDLIKHLTGKIDNEVRNQANINNQMSVNNSSNGRVKSD